MAGPAITLTATLQDTSGQAVGSVANPAKLCLTLCGFGNQLPRISGTALIARPGPFYFEAPAGTVSIAVYGNDVIIPTGTYYTVELLDGAGNVVQCAAYLLTGSGTKDLSGLTPIAFPGSSAAAATQNVYFAGAPQIQTATGTINGTNKIFTFTAPPSPTPQLSVFVAGIFMTPIGATPDYTLVYSGSNLWTITFTTAPNYGPVTIQSFPQTSSGQRTITAPAAIVVTGITADGTLFCNFSAPGTITLPTAATAGAGYELCFIDVSYLAATNNITLSGSINNAPSYVINTNGGAVTIKSDGAAWRVRAKV
jgi:hypothetical protein